MSLHCNLKPPYCTYCEEKLLLCIVGTNVLLYGEIAQTAQFEHQFLLL